MATSKQAVFSEMQVRNIRKSAAMCHAQATEVAKHLGLMEKLLDSGLLNLHSLSKMANEGLRLAASIGKTLDRLWDQVGAATEKLPREERKRCRKELERELSRLEGQLAKLNDSSRRLRKAVDQHSDDDIISKAGPDILDLVEILVRIFAKWSKEFRAAAN